MPFQDTVKHSIQDALAQEGLVHLIATVITREVAKNDEVLRISGGRPDRVTVFHGNKAPDINSADYLERIRTYGGCSACCFVLGLQYVERLQQIDPAYKLNSFNMHRLVVTGIMVAAKFVDDFYFSNNYWSKVAGISFAELNGLELELLFLLNFSLHTTRSQYDEYVAQLKRRNAGADDMLVMKIGSLSLSHPATASRVGQVGC